MNTPVDGRPPAAEAPPALLVLQKWEDFCSWFLEHTARWPKSMRFVFAHRIQNHALDVLEMLVEARYEREDRDRLLRRANLHLERMRFLLRIATGRGITSGRAFERAMRDIDETGRMLHGWRQTVDGRRAS